MNIDIANINVSIANSTVNNIPTQGIAKVDLNEMLKHKIEVVQKIGLPINTINCVRYPKSVVKEKIITNRFMNSNLDLYDAKIVNSGMHIIFLHYIIISYI